MHLPSTHWSLLLDLPGDPDGSGEPGIDWTLFVAVYRPPILEWFLAKRLQACDAEDVAQQVLLKLHKNLGRYDRERGPFRPWLSTLLGRVLIDFYREQQRRPGRVAIGGSEGLDALADLADARSLDDLCSVVVSHGQSLADRAMQVVRGRVAERTWRAFQEHGLSQRPAREVADELQMTVVAVHQARFRVLQMVQAEYARSLDTDRPPPAAPEISQE